MAPINAPTLGDERRRHRGGRHLDGEHKKEGKISGHCEEANPAGIERAAGVPY